MNKVHASGYRLSASLLTEDKLAYNAAKLSRRKIMTEKVFAGCVFDPKQAEKMIGKSVLVSLTCMNDFGDLDAFEQFVGPILRIDNKDGLVVKREDTGEEFSIPPDLDHYLPAKPGDYKLAESETIVTNPDFLVEWDIYPPDPS